MSSKDYTLSGKKGGRVLQIEDLWSSYPQLRFELRLDFVNRTIKRRTTQLRISIAFILEHCETLYACLVS